MLYYKIIDGKEVLSSCKTLKIDGRWISNPTEEMILADGWLPYTPPPVIPVPQEEPDYEQVVEAVKKMFSTDVDELSDEEALDVAALYPTWRSKIGTEVTVGTRLWDDGRLWKVLQPHIVQENWRPEDSPSLYVEVTIEEWPEWKQPTGATDAYMTGDKVTRNNKHWISTVDYNTWEPGVYGWNEA
jgi:hypothetical protein